MASPPDPNPSVSPTYGVEWRRPRGPAPVRSGRSERAFPEAEGRMRLRGSMRSRSRRKWLAPVARGTRTGTLGALALICQLVSASHPVSAATFTASLPNLLGTYDYGSGPTGLGEEIFDLGVKFSEVSEASISITFSASTGIFEACRGQGCTPVAEDLFPGLGLYLRDPFAFLSPRSSGYSSTDLVDVQFDVFWSSLDLGRLLDGSDHVALYLGALVCIPENLCSFSTSPVATVSVASVSVTGTVVPEPSTLILLALGILGIAGLAPARGSAR